MSWISPTPPPQSCRPAVRRPPELGVEQSLADATVMVRYFLANRPALTLGDEAALDDFDETARTPVLPRPG